MENEQMVAFIKNVVKAIQTDFPNTTTCRDALVDMLNEADDLHIKLTGNPIVIRGNQTLLGVIAGQNHLSKIPNKAK